MGGCRSRRRLSIYFGSVSVKLIGFRLVIKFVRGFWVFFWFGLFIV